MGYLEKTVQDLEKNGLDPYNMKKKLDDYESKINDNASNLNIGKNISNILLFILKWEFNWMI